MTKLKVSTEIKKLSSRTKVKNRQKSAEKIQKSRLQRKRKNLNDFNEEDDQNKVQKRKYRKKCTNLDDTDKIFEK